MEATGIIVIILWSILSLLTMIQYAPLCKDLPLQDQLLAGLIFWIGGPIFAAANILEALLDCILPEGWGDDDGPWQH